MAAIHQLFTRRQFLHASLITLGSLALWPGPLAFAFDPAMKLGRVNVGMAERKARPDADSATF